VATIRSQLLICYYTQLLELGNRKSTGMEWFLFLESLPGNDLIYTWEKYRLILSPWEVN